MGETLLDSLLDLSFPSASGAIAAPFSAPGGIPAPFSAPAISEVLISLGRSLNPRWRQCYGPAAPTVAPDREHAALRLGIMTAELMLAAQARDDVQASQRLSDTAAVEKLLGISTATRPRHLLLHALGEAGEWETFRRSVEALNEEQRLALEAQRDPDLARLLPVASWLRIMEVEAILLAARSAPTLEPVGLHPHIVSWVENELSNLSDHVRTKRSVSRCLQVTQRLSRLLQQSPTEAGRREMLADTLQSAMTRLLTP